MKSTVPEPRPAHNEAQDIALEIVFEDEHLLVVDKPAGMVVHPAAGNLDGTLVNALLHHCAGRLSGIGGVARPGIVHRIDKDTSGLLVVAKTDVAHEGLAAQFARTASSGAIWRSSPGVPMPAERHGRRPARPLGREPQEDGDRRGRARQAGGDALPNRRSRCRDAALVECRLETGRTHQVRVHMASIGHPLLGDPVYGRARPAHREVLKRLNFHRQALHAAALGFVHPVSKENLTFKSALPSDIQELIAALTV